MGWSIGYDSSWRRDIGYGVPAYCDHPKCNEEIDRGLAYVCGGEPYGGDYGCGLYFCEKHRAYYTENRSNVCARCGRYRPPFKPKPEHPTWINHKLTDPSWALWRALHPPGVEQLRAQLTAAPTDNGALTHQEKQNAQ